jgi:subtilisin
MANPIQFNLKPSPSHVHMSAPFNLATGSGIKVAIVDDGVYPQTSSIRNLKGGTDVILNNKSLSCNGNGITDLPGSHGTICAALISRRAPDAVLYSIKVLDLHRNGPPSALVRALEWVIENDVDVVNLSLGTTNGSYAKDLRRLCVRAVEQGIVLVAATHNGGLLSYPSAFPEVLAVTQDNRYTDYQFGYYPRRRAEWRAAGEDVFSVAVSNTANPEYSAIALSGSSLATARMTGNVAALLEILPQADLARLKDELAARETKLLARAEFSPRYRAMPEPDERSILSSHLRNIRRVAIYPNDSTTEIVLANRDQFDFAVDTVIDPVHPSAPGRDAGYLYGLCDLSIPVVRNFDGVGPETDTLIIGDLQELLIANKEDYLYEACRWTVNNGKHLINLGSFEPHIYQRLYEEAQRKNLMLTSAIRLGLDGLPTVTTKQESAAPVVFVCGTSFNQGKFTVQLALRRFLKKAGYRVAMVASNPLASLIQGGICVPPDIVSDYLLLTQNSIDLVEKALRSTYGTEPDVIIVGSPGGVIPAPFDYPVIDQYHLAPPLYSLACLTATRPDAAILAINSIDPEVHIERCITAVESVGRTQVIALVVANKLVYEGAYTRKQKWGRTLRDDELLELKRTCEQRFGLPLFCPFSFQEQEDLTSFLIDSFQVD